MSELLAEAKVAALEDLAGDDPEFLADIVAGYEKTVREAVAGLRQDGNVARWCHHLLGGSREVGATRVAQECAALEAAPHLLPGRLDALEQLAMDSAAALRHRLLKGV